MTSLMALLLGPVLIADMADGEFVQALAMVEKRLVCVSSYEGDTVVRTLPDLEGTSTTGEPPLARRLPGSHRFLGVEDGRLVLEPQPVRLDGQLKGQAGSWIHPLKLVLPGGRTGT